MVATLQDRFPRRSVVTIELPTHHADDARKAPGKIARELQEGGRIPASSFQDHEDLAGGTRHSDSDPAQQATAPLRVPGLQAERLRSSPDEHSDLVRQVRHEKTPLDRRDLVGMSGAMEAERRPPAGADSPVEVHPEAVHGRLANLQRVLNRGFVEPPDSAQYGDHLQAFSLRLGWRRQVLEIAAAALSVMPAGRHDPVRRRAQDLEAVALGIARTHATHAHADALPGERPLHEDHESADAGHAAAAKSQVGDLERDLLSQAKRRTGMAHGTAPGARGCRSRGTDVYSSGALWGRPWAG